MLANQRKFDTITAMVSTVKRFLHYFFAKEGVYPPAGLPSMGWFLLMVTTFLSIYHGLKRTAQCGHEEVRRILRRDAVMLWILELVKITYRFLTGFATNLNTWLPLYFCSITLYAIVMSCSKHPFIQHIGDVFITTGGLCGGACFLLYPSTTLLLFPTLHYLSIHSFLYHGTMVYLGILLSRSGTVNLQRSDLKYYMAFTGFFCLLALVINHKLGLNMMFISAPMEGTILGPISWLLDQIYTPVLVLVQMTVPFLVVLHIKQKSGLLDRPSWYQPIAE